jgi:hypothetical protein
VHYVGHYKISFQNARSLQHKIYYTCNLFSVRLELTDLPNVSRFIINSVTISAIVPSTLHTHLHLRVVHTKGTNGRNLETIHSEIGESWIQNTLIFVMGI